MKSRTAGWSYAACSDHAALWPPSSLLFHVKQDVDAIVSGLSAEQRGQLGAFSKLLQGWGAKFGLIGPAEGDRVWQRHIRDSLRAVPCIDAADRDIFDLGSGAGLPGVPIAIAVPRARMVLIEPKGRRAAFLELVVERLSLTNTIVLVAAAGAVKDRADLVTARALAPPAEAWRLAEPLLNEWGRLLYFAGRRWRDSGGGAVSAAGGRVDECVPANLEWEGSIVMISRRSDPERVEAEDDG